MKVHPLRPGDRHGSTLLPLLFNVLLEDLTREINQKTEIKNIQIRKEEVKLALFADDIILYVENPTDPTKQLLEIVKHIQENYRIQNKQKNQLYHYI